MLDWTPFEHSHSLSRDQHIYARKAPMTNFNWICPHCQHHVTIWDERFSEEQHINCVEAEGGIRHAAITKFITCPNRDCQKITLTCSIHKVFGTGRGWQIGSQLLSRRLIPASNARPFPGYVPAPIRVDYEEACLIRDLSPKASATLARRCLQGMVRDRWKVKGRNLAGEIQAIQDKVDPEIWEAIEAVRKVGNIGAHMEKDIDVIVDVEPGEAGLLIQLIEDLIDDWYVARHKRQTRLAKIAGMAAAKERQRKGEIPERPTAAEVAIALGAAGEQVEADAAE